MKSLMIVISFGVFFGFSSQADARSIIDWWKGVTGPGYRADAKDIDNEIENCGNRLKLKLHEAEVSPAFNRGILWRRKGQYKKAIRDFGIALQKHSNLQVGLLERGRTFIMIGRYHSAVLVSV